MRHAFLIVAHNEFAILQKLVALLDNPLNDIYVHYDKKVNVTESLQVKYSNIVYMADNKRVNISWGVTQVSCTLNLIELALTTKKKYDYFHLLSGVDLPIKTNSYIHDFFLKNEGKEFVGFNNNEFTQRDLFERLSYYHLFEINKRRSNLIFNVLHKTIITTQKLFRCYRFKDLAQFRKGCNWFSISYSLASDIIKEKNELIRMYRYALCSDEIFMQTFVYNHQEHFKNVFNIGDEYEGCLRAIDWNRGDPYVWGREQTDFEELISSKHLFARKFCSSNKEIIDQIYAYLYKQNEEYAKSMIK